MQIQNKRLGFRRHFAVAGLAGTAALAVGLFVFAGQDSPNSMLSETAWRAALQTEPQHDAWPWETASAAPESPVVRQLGFSAVLKNAPVDQVKLASLSHQPEGAPKLEPAVAVSAGKAEPELQPEDVAVGDKITVVTPDGLSHIYKVTAREVMQQANAAGKINSKLGGKTLPAQPAKMTSCSSLDSFVAGAFRLVIEAVQNEPSHTQPAPEQKL
jgi:hypothetical protein